MERKESNPVASSQRLWIHRDHDRCVRHRARAGRRVKRVATRRVSSYGLD